MLAHYTHHLQRARERERERQRERESEKERKKNRERERERERERKRKKEREREREIVTDIRGNAFQQPFVPPHAQCSLSIADRASPGPLVICHFPVRIGWQVQTF